MHPTPASTEKPLRAASTLILLRDSDTGPQVLMLKRHGLSEVLAGAFVFPGGKLDAPDAELMDSPHLDEAAPVLHARLGEHDIGTALAVGLYVAALRETFEESGLLLAEDLAETRAQEALARLASGMAFNTLLAEMGLRLRVGALAPWSRWVTPPDSPNKRFAPASSWRARQRVWRVTTSARPPRRAGCRRVRRLRAIGTVSSAWRHRRS